MQSHWFLIAPLVSVIFSLASVTDDEEIKLADCPQAVRKTLENEARGFKIEMVRKTNDEDDETVYWAKVIIGGRTYDVGTFENGTLTEVNLATDDEDTPLDRCPAIVQTTFRSEAFGEKIEAVSRDVKYGSLIYQTVVNHRGKPYEIVVAEDGTLVEKVLVINDEEIKLTECPATVRTALHEHANGGEIGDITRSTGIGQNTYEAEVKIKDKVYLIEVAESGHLISKSLEAARE
jgi:hypothetical protein